MIDRRKRTGRRLEPFGQADSMETGFVVDPDDPTGLTYMMRSSNGYDVVRYRAKEPERTPALAVAVVVLLGVWAVTRVHRAAL